jgi:hypothetical protein
VADVVRRYGESFLARHGWSLCAQQRRALRDLARCRSAALGGHVEACTACDYQRIAYNSCRNRHCPKCQASSRAAWLEARAAELLPVPYFHVVFTLPDVISGLALGNPRVVYGILFRAAVQTLLEVAANPQRLGARIGGLAVLHTWGQNLHHHPHVHCIVPGGGFSADETGWIAGRPQFFLPVRILSRVFRAKFLDLLRRTHQLHQLIFAGRLAELADAAAFERLLDASVRTDWVVYAKPPFGGPEQVLKYLARYTHRVAIANSRLESIDDGQVTFRWKNYAQGQAWQSMSLSADEFLRRFLLHVLPSGFVKIRHFGFLGNRRRRERLAAARKMLGDGARPPSNCDAKATPRGTQEEPDRAAASCPACRRGVLAIIGTLSPLLDHQARCVGAAADPVSINDGGRSPPPRCDSS